MQLDALMGRDISVIPHFTFSHSDPEHFITTINVSLVFWQLKEKGDTQVVLCIITLCYIMITLLLFFSIQYKHSLSHTHT